MSKIDKIDFYGVELTKHEKESYRAWLSHPEGKVHEKVVAGMIRYAELNAMKDPVQGQDKALFDMQREQNLGERKGLKKIPSRIINSSNSD